HGNAVPTNPGAWKVRLEGERLGGGRLNHLPDGYPESIAEHRDLVDEADIDKPIGVLDKLGKLGDLGARALHDLRADRLVEGRRQRPGEGGQPTDQLWRVLDGPGRIAGVDPLRTEGDEIVQADLQLALRQERAQNVAGGAWRDRGLQDHQHARVQIIAQA